MNGYRVVMATGPHLEQAEYWRSSLRAADELIRGVIGETRQLKNIKQVSLCLMTKHLVEHDRGDPHGH